MAGERSRDNGGRRDMAPTNYTLVIGDKNISSWSLRRRFRHVSYFGSRSRFEMILSTSSSSSISVKTNWPTKFLNAAWNWQFVDVEGSMGVHNAPYAVGVLKASIADLTGDANKDGLSDSWQIQYFGSASAPNAGPNASPAGDGIPNWLKYGLGN